MAKSYLLTYKSSIPEKVCAYTTCNRTFKPTPWNLKMCSIHDGRSKGEVNRYNQYMVVADDEELPENITTYCKSAHLSQIPVLEDMKKKRSFVTAILDVLETKYEEDYVVEGINYDLYLPETHTLIFILSTANHNAFRLRGEFIAQKLVMNARYFGYRCIILYDWDKVENILMSLKPPKYKVKAHDCELRSISTEECNLFMMINYLYKVPLRSYHSYQYGLFYNDELIAMMQFKKANGRKYEWELWHYCTNSDYKIYGAPSKLFRQFIEDVNPESVVAFCDLNKYSGSLFQYIGMKSDGFVPNMGRTWSKGIEQKVNSPTDQISEFDLLKAGWCLVNNLGKEKYEYFRKDK